MKLVRRRDTRTVLLAGWLFADLLAFLFIIELSTVPPAPAAQTTATPSHSSSPSPSPSHGFAFGLDPKWQPVTLSDVDFAGLEDGGANGQVARALVSKVSAKLAGDPGGHRPVGLILTDTSGPESSSGISTADRISGLLNSALLGQSQYSHAVVRAGWDGGLADSTIYLEVFFDNVS